MGLEQALVLDPEAFTDHSISLNSSSVALELTVLELAFVDDVGSLVEENSDPMSLVVQNLSNVLEGRSTIDFLTREFGLIDD